MRRARPPVTEPVAVPCLYVTEIDAIVSDGHIRLIGIVDVPAVGGASAERRIVARLVLAVSTARELHNGLRAALGNLNH